MTPTPAERSMVGKTLLKGHALRREGRIFDPSGSLSNGVGCGECSCGAMSADLPTTAARKRWHADHKEKVRSGEARYLPPPPPREREPDDRDPNVISAADAHQRAVLIAGAQGAAYVLTGDAYLVRYERKGSSIERRAPERVNREQRRRMGLPRIPKNTPPLAAFREVWAP